MNAKIKTILSIVVILMITTIGIAVNYKYTDISNPKLSNTDGFQQGNTSVNGSGIDTDNININNNITFNKSISLFPLPYFSYPTFQNLSDNSATRVYFMPKGTVATGLASGIKLFATPYSIDSVDYSDFGIYTTVDSYNFINSKSLGTTPNKDVVFSFNDSVYAVRIPTTSNVNSNSTGIYVYENSIQKRIATTNSIEWIGNTPVVGAWTQGVSPPQTDYDPNLVGELPGYIWNTGTSLNDRLNFTHVKKTRGNYILSGSYVTASNSPNITISYDNQNITTIDQYSAGTVYNVNFSTPFVISKYTDGQLSILVSGKNTSSSGYVARISRIEIIKTG